MPNVILPSILAADFSRLGEQLRQLEEAGAEVVHIDVMDGHFVPNISFGAAMVETCKRASRLKLDVHLMISAPERYLDDFINAGADSLTVHAEASVHLHRTLEAIRARGCRSGLALNPLTPLALLPEALPYLDLLLVMTVNPGFGGQRFIPASLARIERARALIAQHNPSCLLEVDGGLDPVTIPQAVRAGAEWLVVGSALFGEADLKAAFKRLQQSAQGS